MQLEPEEDRWRRIARDWYAQSPGVRLLPASSSALAPTVDYPHVYQTRDGSALSNVIS